MELRRNDNDLSLFNKLFAEYQGRFIRFASTYVDDYMVAEDIVMEAMMYYWENRFRLHSGSTPPAYILTTIKNKCLNYLRDCQYRQTVSQELKDHAEWKLSLQLATLEACNPDELFSKEIQELVKAALDKLPETTRRIFIMRRFEEKSYQEIALQMEMSVRGVEYHMAKATELLKKILKDFLPLLIWLLRY